MDHPTRGISSHLANFVLKNNMSCAIGVAPPSNTHSCLHYRVVSEKYLSGSALLNTVEMYTRHVWHTHRQISDSNLGGVLTASTWGCQPLLIRNRLRIIIRG